MSHVVLKAGLFAAALFLAWEWRSLLALTFAGLLVAVFFGAGGRLMTHVVGGAGGRGLAAFCLALVVAGVGFGLLAVPSLAEQSDELVERVPAVMAEARTFLERRAWGQWVIDRTGLAGSPEEAIERVLDPSMVADQAYATALIIVWVGAASAFLLFVGLYIAAAPKHYGDGVLWLLPPRHREAGDRCIKRVSKTLVYWLYGQLSTMTLEGLLCGVGLWILGVPLPFINGVFVFLASFVPNFGPIVSALPPILLALAVDPNGDTLVAGGVPLALAVIVLYVGVQSLESYIITPLIQQRAVELPPALLIVTQLVLGLTLGLVGLIIAAPLTAAAMAALRELFIVGEVGKEEPTDTDPVLGELMPDAAGHG